MNREWRGWAVFDDNCRFNPILWARRVDALREMEERHSRSSARLTVIPVRLLELDWTPEMEKENEKMMREIRARLGFWRYHFEKFLSFIGL